MLKLVCLRCPHVQPPPYSGPCACTVDGRDIGVHVRERQCPAGLFPEDVAPPSPPRRAGGPGTELKKLLARRPWRFVATKSCNCTAYAAMMDRKGADWCQANLDAIVFWLRAQAKAQQVPFVEVVARWIVKRAIFKSRR